MPIKSRNRASEALLPHSLHSLILESRRVKIQVNTLSGLYETTCENRLRDARVTESCNCEVSTGKIGKWRQRR